jgi:cell division protein ZapA (FtsZ GTPase activity inhibitor)
MSSGNQNENVEKTQDRPESGGTRQIVAVRIAGHEYKIRSDGDADSLREIAGYVDRAMSRVRERTGTVDTLDVAVLTSLNLAREILTLREERVPQGMATVDDDKMQSLIARVEDALGQVTLAGPSEEKTSETVAASEEPVAPARTLELPSVESLQERAAGNSSVSLSNAENDAIPEARVASGGRDRAS